MSDESASPLPEGRAGGREAWEVEADVLDLARRTVLGATAIDQDRYGPGLRFAGAALEAMAYERRNHDWIESVRAAAPVVPVGVQPAPEWSCDEPGHLPIRWYRDRIEEQTQRAGQAALDRAWEAAHAPIGVQPEPAEEAICQQRGYHTWSDDYDGCMDCGVDDPEVEVTHE